MQTLGQLKQFATESLHEDVADAKIAALLLPRWVEQTVHRINSFHRWRWNEGLTTLTWPATQVLYLPEWMDYPLSLRPPSTVSYSGVIEVLNAASLDRGMPEFATDGTIRIVVYGHFGVEADMPAAGTVTVASSLIGDVGMQVLVEGRSVAGREQLQIVTLANVGGVATATTTLTFAGGVEGVRRIAIVGRATTAVSPAWGVGIVTATSGGTTLEVLDSVYENLHFHRRAEIYGAAGAVPCRYYRRHRALYRDTDLVDVPREFEEIVELGLQERLALFKENAERAQIIHGLATECLKGLIGWDGRQPALQWVPSIRER